MGEAPKWESSRLPQSPTRCTAPRVTATDPMCLFGSDAFQSDSRGLHWWQTLLCFQFSNRRPNLDCPVTPERLIRDYPKKSNLLLHTGHLCSLSGVLTQREMTDIFPFHGHLVWVIWILRFYHQPLGSGCGHFCTELQWSLKEQYQKLTTNGMCPGHEAQLLLLLRWAARPVSLVACLTWLVPGHWACGSSDL